jgi:hypothetical protein
MNKKTGPSSERSFGVSVGSVLIAFAGILWWRGRVGRSEILGAIGLSLLACGLAYPTILKWPSAWWWRFSRVLGYVNARVILTVLFSLVLVPISFVWRLTGKDPLARRRGRVSGWSPYPARYRSRTHYRQMF